MLRLPEIWRQACLYDKRDITTPTTDVGAGWMDPWFWAIYNQNGDAYDTFSGNRNPVGGLIQGGTEEKFINNFPWQHVKLRTTSQNG